MKVCLRARQDKKYLKKADEIKFEYRDKKGIPSYAEDYPEATMILYHRSADDEIDWKEIKQYKILTRDKFIIALTSVYEAIEAKENDIPFFFDFNITTFDNLNSIKDLGACYIRVGAPLFFQMDKIKMYNIPVRAVPNVCRRSPFPHNDGVVGTWIRPEDLNQYEDYISCIEFEDCDTKEKEQAMYRIYMEQHAWPGEFDMLYTGINFDGVNRMLPPDFTTHRLNCGQRCADPKGRCHICNRLMRLANPDRLQKYLDAIKEEN